MENLLARKLEHFCLLEEADRHALDGLIGNRKFIPSHTSLLIEGEAPTRLYLILNGLASRSKTLPAGERQIFGFLLPGDLCGLYTFIGREADHDVITFTDCVVAEIEFQAMLDITERHFRIARALWRVSLTVEVMLREWIVNLALRRAEKRLAHLFCELLVRLERVGLVKAGSFELPLTQRDLGDVLALTAVHINRSLRELREAGLVTVKKQTVLIHDVERLKKFAGFSPNYLHLLDGKQAEI